jgi:hypothetical protein
MHWPDSNSLAFRLREIRTLYGLSALPSAETFLNRRYIIVHIFLHDVKMKPPYCGLANGSFGLE